MIGTLFLQLKKGPFRVKSIFFLNIKLAFNFKKWPFSMMGILFDFLD